MFPRIAREFPQRTGHALQPQLFWAAVWAGNTATSQVPPRLSYSRLKPDPWATSGVRCTRWAHQGLERVSEDVCVFLSQSSLSLVTHPPTGSPGSIS